MEEPQRDQAQAESRLMFADAVRGNALGLLIGGGVCLYFGFTLVLDAPGSVTEEAAEFWFAIDRVFQWVLRVVGVVFLAAAAWALTGSRGAALLAVIAESAFALLMCVWAVETVLEARADGVFDAFVILLVILAILGISGAKRSWVLYTAMGRPAGDLPADNRSGLPLG